MKRRKIHLSGFLFFSCRTDTVNCRRSARPTDERGASVGLAFVEKHGVRDTIVRIVARACGDDNDRDGDEKRMMYL